MRSGARQSRISIILKWVLRKYVIMWSELNLRRCIQKFPDWVNKEINTRWEATQRVMAAKLTRLTHKIAIQLHLVAESCTICSSRSRRLVRKLLDTPPYVRVFFFVLSQSHDMFLCMASAGFVSRTSGQVLSIREHQIIPIAFTYKKSESPNKNSISIGSEIDQAFRELRSAWNRLYV
jgi:hypothetical protein